MQRLRSVLWVLILFEFGVVLVLLPWLQIWESNYILAQFPALRPYVLHPALRGAISGLGTLDILLAIEMGRALLRMKPSPARGS
jgi:hypothetical protein